MPVRTRTLPPQMLWFGLCLAFCLGFAHYQFNPRATGQTNCQVDCTITVPSNSTVGNNVSFTATSSAMNCATPVSYEWDFGDGGPRATTAIATHSYVAPGTYTWRMTARAGSGSMAPAMIDTVVGGYGEGVAVRQAPFSAPTAITRDPLGRGLYLFDQADDGGLRFINTSNIEVMIAGKRIRPGTGGVLPAEHAELFYTQSKLTVTGMVASADGNLLFITDSGTNEVLALNVANSTQIVFGSVLQPGKALTLVVSQYFLDKRVSGIAVHPQTGQVYFADDLLVYRITGLNQQIIVAGNGASTLPGNLFPGAEVPALSVPLLRVRDLAFDASGTLYIADAGHGRIIKLNGNGTLSLVTQLQIQVSGTNFLVVKNPYPSGLALFNGNIYAATGNQQTVWRLDSMGLAQPVVVAGAAYTSCLYGNSNCGDGGPVAEARFNLPGPYAGPSFVGLEADANGLFLLDQSDVRRGRVRYLNLSAQPVTLAGTLVPPNQAATIAGTGAPEPFENGPATAATLTEAAGVSADPNGNLWIADRQRGTLRFVNRGNQAITLFANTPAEQTIAAGHIATINREITADEPGFGAVPVNQAIFNTPQGIRATNQGVFVVDTKRGPTLGRFGRRTSFIRFLNTTNQNVTFYPNGTYQVVVPPGYIMAIAGGGTDESTGTANGVLPNEAVFVGATDIAISPVTNDLYISEYGRIRRIRRTTGAISTVAGISSQYSSLAFDATGRLLVLEAQANRLSRRQQPDSANDTGATINNFDFINVSGIPLNSPRDLALDTAGNVYITNAGTHRVLKLTLSGANASSQIIAGTTLGFGGDGGSALNAQLNFNAAPVEIAALSQYLSIPALIGITVGPNGEVFFADSANHRVRLIQPDAASCTRTGNITVTGNYPLPTISQLSPNSVYVGQPLTLVVNGNGFGPDSRIRWNGTTRATTFVSATQLLATIPASDLIAPDTPTITVFNPMPGGGVSNAVVLTITRPPNLPVITQLTPTRVNPGSPAFRLTLSGAFFTPNSVVLWNGLARTTIYVNQETLQVDVSANELQAKGIFILHVYTPAPGGGLSSPANLYIGCTPLTFLPASLPSATVGLVYAQILTVESAAGSYTITHSGGSLPPGLTLNSNGTLSGVPTKAGAYTFTLTATDATGCTGSQTFTLRVACYQIEITPQGIDDGEQGVPYRQPFFALGTSNSHFSVTAGALPPGLLLSPNGLLSGTPTQGGSFSFTLTVTDVGGCTGSRTYTIGVRNFAIRLVDGSTCISPGSVIPVEVSLTNHTTEAKTIGILLTARGPVKPVSGYCLANIGSCSIGPDSSGWNNTLLSGQTVTIRFLIQVQDDATPGVQFCATAVSSLDPAGPYTPRSACATVNCPTAGVGAIYPSASTISDQKAGSILLFNLYTSDAGAPNRQNTRISLTNTDPSRTAYLHLFFVDGASCAIADSVVCLTPNQTAAFFASDIDPGTTGYVIAVATDRSGCPINFNYLIGDAYVKLGSGHVANLAAEAIAAVPGGFVPCDPNAAAVELRFDNLMYNALPRVLGLSNISSVADGNNTLLVVNRLGGNLATGAATLTGVFGILYDDAEAPFSFSFSPGTCQFRSIVNNSFPRTAPRFEQIVPAGRSGWLKLGMQSDGAISGAALNFNANAATSANAFNQAHNLHKLTLTPSATLTIPVFPPSC